MAALTEADLKLILGDQYKQANLDSDSPANIKANAEKNYKARIVKLDNTKFSAVALIMLGIVLFTTNYLAISGPSLLPVAILGLVMLAIGVVWYVYTRKAMSKALAEGPAVS